MAVAVRRPRPATAALAALQRQSDLVESGFDIRKAVGDYFDWFFTRIPKAQRQNPDSKLSAIGIDDPSLEIFINAFARNIIGHAEWNVDPDKLSNVSQAGFAKQMNKKTVGYCIDYLVALVKRAQK